MPADITQAQAMGKVAVLMGGSSSEREVSLDSGSNVLAALQTQGIDAFAVDGIPALVSLLVDKKVDRVFNILHGNKGGGEDGVLQGLLEADLHVAQLGVPRLPAPMAPPNLEGDVGRPCRRGPSGPEGQTGNANWDGADAVLGPRDRWTAPRLTIGTAQRSGPTPMGVDWRASLRSRSMTPFRIEIR